MRVPIVQDEAVLVRLAKGALANPPMNGRLHLQERRLHARAGRQRIADIRARRPLAITELGQCRQDVRHRHLVRGTGHVRRRGRARLL